MQISINNKIETLEKGLTVQQALKALGFIGDDKNIMLGVAVNKTFVAKTRWAETVLKENDEVDILNPVSGG